MAKISWSYTGKTPPPESKTLTGRLQAETLEEVKTILANMGLINPMIVPTDNAGVGVSIPEHIIQSTKTNTPNSIIPQITSTERTIAPQLSPMERTTATRLVKNLEMEEMFEKEDNMDNGKLRQTLVLGTEQVVQSKINALLDIGGKIINIQMCPNHHGQTIFAIVVEHLEKNTEKNK